MGVETRVVRNRGRPARGRYSSSGWAMPAAIGMKISIGSQAAKAGLIES